MKHQSIFSLLAAVCIALPTQQPATAVPKPAQTSRASKTDKKNKKEKKGTKNGTASKNKKTKNTAKKKKATALSTEELAQKIFSPTEEQKQKAETYIERNGDIGLESAIKSDNDELVYAYLISGVNTGKALSTAIKYDKPKYVRLITSAPGIDINSIKCPGGPPLYEAAEAGKAACLKALLEVPGIDVNNGPGYNGRVLSTPLGGAAEHGHTECLKLLLAAPGINVNANQCALEFGAVYTALLGGHADCLKLLLAAEGIKTTSFPPLLLAVVSGNIQETKRLIKNGADVNQTWHNEWTTIPGWAIMGGQVECLKLLLASSNIDASQLLKIAALNNQLECLQYLLTLPNLSSNEKACRAALETAAGNGHLKCIKLLLSTPAITENTEACSVALRLAVSGSLYKSQASVSERYTEAVKLLRSIPNTNTDGISPLWLAYVSGNMDEVKKAINKGADVNIEDIEQTENKIIPLILAAQRGDIEMMKILLAAPGVNVNTTDAVQQTALYWAASGGSTECLKLLLKASGIDTNKSDPLAVAAISGHIECVKLLLTAPGINLANSTALHKVAVNGEFQLIRLLTDAGMNVNKADHRGNTPLHYAAKNGNIACVKRLLEAPGIDISKTNNMQKTPLDEAISGGHTDVANILKEASVK